MQDDIKIADNEYLSAKKKYYDIEKELMTELSEKQKNKLKELINSLSTTSFIESKQNFFNGFKIGANIIFEIFSR